VLVILIGSIAMVYFIINHPEQHFYATVSERKDDYLLVEPLDGSKELNYSEKIKVGLKGKSSWPIPQVGNLVRVVYNGRIQKTDPACITKPCRVEIIVSAENNN
jgi:hypothetical protein